MKVVRHLFLISVGAALAQAQSSTAQPDGVSPFKHVVIIFQENRTPDNLFFGLCLPPYGTTASCSATPDPFQYNIQTSHWANNRSRTGETRPLPESLAIPYDLSHAHAAFTAMCNADSTGTCKMDGAANIPCSGKCLTQPQFRYVDSSTGQIDSYLDLATQYGWANYMFQTNQGPSYPAHQFMFGGTSAPNEADDALGIFASENMYNTGTAGTGAVAGCTASTETMVQLIGPDGVEEPNDRVYPCFDHRTLADILPSNLTWRYYTPSAGSIWTAPNSISHICESTGPKGDCVGPKWIDNVDLNPPDVFSDVASCQLRSVSWVIPKGQYSDHPGGTTDEGPSWVGDVVNAIGNSSKCDGGFGYWKDTAVVIAWDDWGGFYDHEAPRILEYPEGGYQYGFRVPMIVVSAFTPKGYINNDRHDFGSVLRFVEKNFGLEPGKLNFANARATNDLGLFFDFYSAPRKFQTIKTKYPASYFIDDSRKATDPDDQ